MKIQLDPILPVNDSTQQFLTLKHLNGVITNQVTNFPLLVEYIGSLWLYQSHVACNYIFFSKVVAPDILSWQILRVIPAKNYTNSFALHYY
jgi:hypothetical protein